MLPSLDFMRNSFRNACQAWLHADFLSFYHSIRTLHQGFLTLTKVFEEKSCFLLYCPNNINVSLQHPVTVSKNSKNQIFQKLSASASPPCTKFLKYWVFWVFCNTQAVFWVFLSLLALSAISWKTMISLGVSAFSAKNLDLACAVSTFHRKNKENLHKIGSFR